MNAAKKAASKKRTTAPDEQTWEWECAMAGLSNIGLSAPDDLEDGDYPLSEPVKVSIQVVDGRLERLHGLN